MGIRKHRGPMAREVKRRQTPEENRIEELMDWSADLRVKAEMKQSKVNDLMKRHKEIECLIRFLKKGR